MLIYSLVNYMFELDLVFSASFFFFPLDIDFNNPTL